MPTDHIAVLAGDGRVRDRSGRNGCLFHPVVDFLCMGGGSIVVLALILLFLPTESFTPGFAIATLIISHFVNNPHFAHSYQLFYRDFGRKAFGRDGPPTLRARYIVAGLVVPAALILFFAVTVARRDAVMLGFGANLMAFFVGWHYVKQGYGMLIVDSVLKRRFFTAAEKRIFLINCYSTWALAWLYANWALAANDFMGLEPYLLSVPFGAILLAGAVAGVTTALTLVALFRRWRGGDGLPVNGTVAYVTTVYVWLFSLWSFSWANPLFVMLVPAFHSLQYLLIVWRYELNASGDRPGASQRPRLKPLARLFSSMAVLRFAGFVAFGIVLAFIGATAAPKFLDSTVPYDHAVFGGAMFVFMFVIFINVHHYFLDNVMWRGENPEIRKHLFSHG